MASFKEENDLEKRTALSAKILSQYPTRIPVIVERAKNATDMPLITKKKYLAPNDIAVANFVVEIRKHIQIPPEKAIFLFVHGNIIPQPASLMSQMYEKYKDADGFLYLEYSGEDVYGCAN